MSSLIGSVSPAAAIDSWGPVSGNIDGTVFNGQPQSADSADGSKVIAVFRGFVASKWNLYAAVATVDDANIQTWSAPQLVYTPESGQVARPQVAMSADGSKATAIFADNTNPAKVKSVSATINGTTATWGAVTTIGNGGNSHRLAVTPDGTRVLAAYMSSDGFGQPNKTMAVVGDVSGNSQTWGTPLSIEGTGLSTNYPQALLSADGKSGAVVFSEQSGNGPSGMAGRAFTVSDAGLTMTFGTAAYAVSPGDAANATTVPTASLSTNGTVLNAAWQKVDQNDAANNGVQAATATIVGTTLTWSSVTNVVTAPSQSSSYPRLGSSADGSKATVVFLGAKTGSDGVWQVASATVAGGTPTWGVPVDIGGAGSISEYQPGIKVSTDGKRVVATAPLSSKLLVGTGEVTGTTSTWGTPYEVPGITIAPDVTLVGSVNARKVSLVFQAAGRIQSISGSSTAPAPTVANLSPASGPAAGGTTITITGTNLHEAAVTVGGNACTNVVVNEAGTSLTCSTPAHSVGTASVVVTTDGGEVTAGNFTYENSAPSVKKPRKPTKVSVSGGPNSAKRVITWKSPSTDKGTRPVVYYRVKVNLERCSKFIVNKKLGKKATSYTVKRSLLLKNMTCQYSSRGEVGNKNARFRVRIEAFNSAGGGPISATRFVVRR